MRRALLAAGVLAASATTASAATFDVAARIFCPASWRGVPDRLDPTFVTAVPQPCAGIRVVVMDADPGLDEYCGSAYTDSGGRVRIRAECGDAVRPVPEVYLRVEGKSVNGFSVGIVEPDVLDRLAESLENAWERLVQEGLPIQVPALDELRAHQTFAWVSPLRTAVRDGGSFDAGDLAMGGNAVAVMAARQFWAAQFATFRLQAGTRYRPMHFNYSVDAPLPPTSGAFTAYDTVVVDFTRTPAAASPPSLAATAHEIGHVLYNTYHSESLHWTADCASIFCFRNHTRCTSNSLGLAWYEGFANFVRDYVHQQWDWPTWRFTTAPPPPGCALEGGAALVDMSVEGNVQGLLNSVYFGPVLREPLLAAANPTAGGLAFGCPDGSPTLEAASGARECDLQVPVTCATGSLRIDASGLRDECLDFVEDPRCAGAPNHDSPNFRCPFDPVRQINTPFCASRVARNGRDTCTTRVPATHTLPNGRPRPRPDGSPDMNLAASTSGGPAWFSLPRLDDVMGWVDEAGTDDHRAREYWERRIRPWCVRGDGSLRDRYCHPLRSPSFLGELTTLDPALN